MKLLRSFFTGAVALVAATTALVQPAAAQTTFTWEQNAGFLFPGANATTTGTLRAGQFHGADLPPLAGYGGLEFSGVQTSPPAPANTYSLIQWGCLADGNNSAGVTDCVNGGTLANVTSAVATALVPGRSALGLTTFTSGTSGVLDSGLGEAGAVRIARLSHFNRVIDNEANALKAVTVSANLVISGAVPPVSNLNTVAITFLETANTATAAGCAAPNPLGSACDDFFTFAGDFQDVPFIHNGQQFFLQFRLRPPADCTLDHSDGTIDIYNCPATADQGAHQIAIDFASGKAWTPEGFDSAVEVWMFVTEEPISTGDQGCTPGYWKQSQHFGSYAAPFFANQTMAAAFATFGGTPNFPKVKNKPDINENTLTLAQALTQGGGGTNALLRHFIAAVLNAANNNVNSKYENIAEIVAAVKAVLDNDPATVATLGGETFTTVEALKNALAASNEGGCPLGLDPGSGDES